MRVVREDESEREKHVEKGRDRVIVEERKGRIEQERGEEGGQNRREGGGGSTVYLVNSSGGREDVSPSYL